ncbi:hypothetical protein R0146_03735 [Raineyella sp. LH-20]|nr:hypothetical protein [Raineyella sp. LH-20]WOP19395.1 hypothetical protein R0146_03735 [Raineyella sp. LH-20]
MPCRRGRGRGRGRDRDRGIGVQSLGAALTSQLQSVQDTAGKGLGFTWPARFPVLRIDQILIRGVQPKNASVLPATGSDHRAVVAGIAW